MHVAMSFLQSWKLVSKPKKFRNTPKVSKHLKRFKSLPKDSKQPKSFETPEKIQITPNDRNKIRQKWSWVKIPRFPPFFLEQVQDPKKSQDYPLFLKNPKVSQN